MIVESLIGAIGFTTDNASANKAINAAKGVEGAMLAIGPAIIASTVALGRMTAAVAEDTKAIERQAIALGMSTDAYQENLHAMGSFGVEASDMADIFAQIAQLSQDAAKGGESSAKAFKDLGISVKSLKGLSPEGIFDAIADGAARTHDPIKRMAALSTILGEDSFKKVAPLLAQGAEGIQKLRDRAHEYGLVLSEEAIKEGKRFSTSLTEIKMVSTGLKNELVTGLLPATADLAESTADLLKQEKGIIQVGADRAINLLSHAMAFGATDAGKFALAVSGVATAIGAYEKAGSMLGALNAVNPALGTMVGSFVSGGAAAARYAIPIALIVLLLDDMHVGATGGQSAIVDLADAFGYGEEMSDRLAGSLEALTDGLELLKITGEGIVGVFDYIGRNSAYAYDEISKFFSGLLADFPMLEKAYEMIMWMTTPGRAVRNVVVNPAGAVWDYLSPERMERADRGRDNFMAWLGGDPSVVFGRGRDQDGNTPMDFGASQRNYYGVQGIGPLGIGDQTLATPMSAPQEYDPRRYSTTSSNPKVNFNLTINASDKRAIMDEINRFGESSLDELDTLR